MSTTIGSYLLPLLSGLAGNTGTAGLTALLAGAANPLGGTGQNPAAALARAERDQDKDIAATGKQPEIQRAVKAFTDAVQKATSPKQLLANPAVLQVLLTANGLADQIPYGALASKALMSDTNDPKSLANALTDTRWKSAAQTYDFANKGLSVIQDPKVLATLSSAYAEVSWRESLDATTPGLSNALTFREQAPTVTSADQILGDPVLRNVVTTALGIPLQIAFQPLEAQEKAITSRLDITKLQDPHFVDSFTQRYLIASAAAQSTTSSSDSSITALAIRAQGVIA